MFQAKKEYIRWRSNLNFLMFILILIVNFRNTDKYYKRFSKKKNWKINFILLYKCEVGLVPRKPRVNFEWTMIYGLEKFAGKCSPCNFQSVEPYHANSSPRDMIMSYATGVMLGAEVWARSIRNSKCKAKIYIICDDSAAKQTLQQHNEAFFKECGITIAIFGQLPSWPPNKGWECFYMYRQAIRYDFLYRYQDEFDRILICDLFDTVFQGDPFTDKIKDDRIYMSIERTPWKGVYGIKSKSCRMVGQAEFRKVMNNSIINGATIFGGYKAVLSLIEALYSTFDPNNLYTIYADDQEFINAIYYTKYIKLPYKFVLFNNSEGYANVCWWPRAGLNYSLGSYVYPKNAIPPLIVHQYNKNTIGRDVKRACPPYYNEKSIGYITPHMIKEAKS